MTVFGDSGKACVAELFDGFVRGEVRGGLGNDFDILRVAVD